LDFHRWEYNSHKYVYRRTRYFIILLFYHFDTCIFFISTYDELGSMGVDFGRLLENPAEEKPSQPPSAPASRSNSRTASITSLSSFMTNDTSKQDEPDEVILKRLLTNIFCCLIFLSFYKSTKLKQASLNKFPKLIYLFVTFSLC